MENHHASNGKIHYFDWAIFNSYVSSPEGIYIYMHIDRSLCLAVEKWFMTFQMLVGFPINRHWVKSGGKLDQPQDGAPKIAFSWLISG